MFVITTISGNFVLVNEMMKRWRRLATAGSGNLWWLRAVSTNFRMFL